MDADNLIFSSKIEQQVQDICFDMLLDYFSDRNFNRVYVKNVVIAPNEIIFFVEIEGKGSIIRIRVEND